MLKHLLSTTAVALIMSGVAQAQIYDDRASGPDLESGISVAQEPSQGALIAVDGTRTRADSLIGLTVLTTDGAIVGDVTDLILDQDDRLRGIIVSTGDLLGFGKRDVGVSWEQADVRSDPETNDTVVVLDLMRADIERVRDFETQENIEAEQAAAGVE